MRTLTKTRITTIAAAFMLAMTASMMFATAHAASSIRVTQSTEDGSNSLRVTQSTEDGLKVECEGNLKCEIIRDGTLVATSEDNTTGTTAATTTATTTLNATTLNQADIAEFSNDFDVIDEQDLGAMIEGMVDRLLEEISGSLANIAIFI
jgi:TRAP-type C4-dicarboxylate transport system substrate-binding protein